VRGGFALARQAGTFQCHLRLQFDRLGARRGDASIVPGTGAEGDAHTDREGLLVGLAVRAPVAGGGDGEFGLARDCVAASAATPSATAERSFNESSSACVSRPSAAPGAVDGSGSASAPGAAAGCGSALAWRRVDEAAARRP
jgi:hypothetical protein